MLFVHLNFKRSLVKQNTTLSFFAVSPGVGSMGVGRQVVGGSVLNNQVVLQTANNQGSRYGSSATSPAAAALLNNLGANSSVTIQVNISSSMTVKIFQRQAMALVYFSGPWENILT